MTTAVKAIPVFFFVTGDKGNLCDQRGEVSPAFSERFSGHARPGFHVTAVRDGGIHSARVLVCGTPLAENMKISFVRRFSVGHS